MDAPFGNQTEVAGINDWGEFAGDSYGGALPDSQYEFVHNQFGFAVQNMPGACCTVPYTLNITGMTGGIFQNPDGYVSGYVNLSGHFHQALGNNDFNQIVGLDYDFDREKYIGVIGTLPLQKSVSR